MIDSRFGNPGHRIVVHNKASWIMLLQMQEHKTSVRNVANSVVRKPNDPLHGSSPGTHRKRLPAKPVPVGGPKPRRAERYPPPPRYQAGQRVTRPHRNRADTYPRRPPATIRTPVVATRRHPAAATTGEGPTNPQRSDTVSRIHSPALRGHARTPSHRHVKDCHIFAIFTGSCPSSKDSGIRRQLGALSSPTGPPPNRAGPGRCGPHFGAAGNEAGPNGTPPSPDRTAYRRRPQRTR